MGEAQEHSEPLENPAISILRELESRANAAGITSKIVQSVADPFGGDHSGYVELEMPNGSNTRRVVANPAIAKFLLEQDFENFRYLGNYQAIEDIRTGMIEARLAPNTGGILPFRYLGGRIPGVELINDDVEPSTDMAYSGADATTTMISRRNDNWKLNLVDGERSIEISPSSDLVLLNENGRSSGFSLKLRGFGTKSHDESLAALNNVGNALLFDLDVRYDVSLELMKSPNKVLRPRTPRMEAPPVFPKNRYAEEAFTLYQHARSASRLPLLQFLAYYQTVEFFFPVFIQEETVKAIRTAILNPRFDPTSDTSVVRLMGIAAPHGSVNRGERGQLLATMRGSIRNDELKEFFESSEIYMNHFCPGKKHKTSKAPTISLASGGRDLSE